MKPKKCYYCKCLDNDPKQIIIFNHKRHICRSCYDWITKQEKKFKTFKDSQYLE